MAKKMAVDKNGFRYEASKAQPQKLSEKEEREAQEEFHRWEDRNARMVRDWNQILER